MPDKSSKPSSNGFKIKITANATATHRADTVIKNTRYAQKRPKQKGDSALW